MANKPLQSIKFPGLSDTYTTPQVDATLTTTGAAADAKKVGDELTSVKQDLSEKGLSDEIKNALLTMFRHVVFLDAEAEDAYSVLESLLLPSIITIGPQALITIQKAKSGYPIALLLYVKPIQNFNGYGKPWTDGNGKNIVPYYVAGSKNNVAITVTSDGVVTANGTASGMFLWGQSIVLDKDTIYRVSGSPELMNTSLTIRDSGGTSVNSNGIVFGTGDCPNNQITRIVSVQDDYDAQCLIRFGSGAVCNNAKFYPMVFAEATGNHISNVVSSGTKDGLTFTKDSQGVISISGTNSNKVYYGGSVTLNAGSYVIGGNRNNVRITLLDSEDGNSMSEMPGFSGDSSAGDRGGSFSIDAQTTMWVAIEIPANTYNNTKVYPIIGDLIEANDSYAPYSNTCPFTQISQVEMNHGASQSSYNTESFDIPQGTSYYGGIIDFVNQTFRAYKHYASYSGQTLEGKWLSSMEEYEAGTFPTSGAEVVDLESFDSLSISVDKIALLSNKNVLWSENGDTLLTYEREV